MSALIILVLISLLVAASFLGAFIWSIRDDQYIDKEGAAMRILFDDEIQKNK
ncbi:MAG: cbb3-type cytochrome oxidase assembly protein CcoS [Taibaiella sp.]|jgi:cbb3-type cytochrome oxidase maturation protein|nr:cbb3-type cytochrome oxidase assembly protein CcoS [Taibaiella sp.]